MSKPNRKVLLLNVSNMDTFPVYPYAFIQVSAIARRSGIVVTCRDLLGIPQTRWGETIQDLISRHLPSMILITLRNTDSLNSTDYERDQSQPENSQPYLPIERTKELVNTIRKVSNLKIVVGGFGFSVLPEELMHYLQPDFGVFGGPDDFFEHFTDIQDGNFDEVSNLFFFRDGRLIYNQRTYFSPFTGVEYTPEIIEEMMAFYTSFPTPGFHGAPVEINRGCNHACVFCSEPLAKGNLVQYKDLSTIMKDIELLVDHGITKFYMISSELNPEGNDFILQVADKIEAFNSNLEDDQKIKWFGANYLLSFSTGEYMRLYDSGFTGGWFDITALDDDNAREMRTPYRNRNVVRHLKNYAQMKQRLNNLGDESVGKDEVIAWTMFLGNPATTIETIRNTLKTAHQGGISNLFESCSLSTSIRVFDYEEPDQATLAVTYSVTNDLNRISYLQLHPSFAYPPALLQDYSEREISEMFKHIAETYLSTKYIKTRDWHNFVSEKTDSANIFRWIEEIESIKGEQLLEHLGFASEDIAERVGPVTKIAPEGGFLLDKIQAEKVIDYLVYYCIETSPDFFESLDLPSTTENLARTTPYDLAVSVYTRWGTNKDFINDINLQSQFYVPKWKRDLLQFCAHALLYKFNIVIQSKYRDIFV